MDLLKDKKKKKEIVAKMIDRACISLNSKCNLNCTYCHFGSKKNQDGYSSHDFNMGDVISIENNIAEYIEKNKMPKFKLGIVGSGEPLLSFSVLSGLVEFVKHSQLREKLKLYTITNGTLITDEILQFFYENQDIIELNFSLDGYQEIQDLSRGMFDVVMRNINKYENLFGHKPPINTVVSKVSIQNKEQLLKFFVTNRFIKVNFSKIFGVVNPTLEVSNDEYWDFLKQAKQYGIYSRQNTLTSHTYDCAKYGTLCGVGVSNIFISKEGIYPCSRYLGNQKYKLGDFDRSLDEIDRQLKQYPIMKEGLCFYEIEELEERK